MSWILAGGRGAGGWQVYFVDLAFGDMKKEACYNFYLLSVGLLRGLRICITSVWVGIQLFIPMRSRIQLFLFLCGSPRASFWVSKIFEFHHSTKIYLFTE